jgi:hypothetical protein
VNAGFFVGRALADFSERRLEYIGAVKSLNYFAWEVRRMNVEAPEVQNDKPLSYLLYLYLWPFWIFEDVNAGSWFERAAAYRRNRSKRIYLPGYTVKWIVVFTMLMAMVFALESVGNAHSAWKSSFALLACGAGILATLAFVVVVMIIALYLLLTHWEH